MRRIVTVLVLTFPVVLHAAPPEAHLAANGKALVPIVVGTNASERVRGAAETLTEYLERICGATFQLEPGQGRSGIVVGRPSDFASLPFPTDFPDGPFNREYYLLRSSAGALYVIGATDLAVEHAVWDVLYRLGYRQFFPGETWEVIPHTNALILAVDVRESPDFAARRIWYNWGTRDYNREPYAQWCARNRTVRGFRLNSGHSYLAIINANKAEFDAHPEYYALVDGERKYRGGSTKFCVANPGLRKLVADYAVRQVQKNPDLDSISRDPSDGSGWCECEACAAMGSVSDRALTLANESAEAINKLGLGDKYVGMYAYNVHCAPPTIKVHPKVIISSTTAFITGGWTQDQIIDGWQAQGATLGIYDYFSVIAWDWNLPRRSRSARPKPLAEKIRRFYEKGARFYDAESGDAWGPYGLGYYVAGRVMWDVTEADRVDAIVDDFLTRAFGPAKKPMAEFYHLIAEDTQKRSNADLVGRMYRRLAEAGELTVDRPDVRRRIDDLVLYTRYVELFNAYANAVGEAKNKAKEAVLRHSDRMRKTMMVHVYGLWSRMIGQRNALKKDHPLKSDDPFTEKEIQGFLTQGIANNQPVEVSFQPVEYSEDLVPAAEPLGLTSDTTGSFPTVPQDRQNYFVWVDKAPAEIHLKVTVQKVWDLRPHRIRLFSPLEVTAEAVDESDVVRPDGKTYDVVLKTPHAGLHRIETRDGGDYTRIQWPEKMPVTLPTAMDYPGVKNHFRGPWTMVFYVPKGTEVVGGWAERIANWAPRISGVIRDGDGHVRYDFSKVQDGWFTVPVPKGQDGRLWTFEKNQGVRYLMTVPPYVARTAEDLLLPWEVVDADTRR